jgi:hypothetical protein
VTRSALREDPAFILDAFEKEQIIQAKPFIGR